MPSQGTGITIGYSAYNTATGVYVTGDVANHTLRLNKNGTIAAPTNSPTEDDATNAPGQYSVLLTNAEAGFPIVKVMGKSSTANVIIIPLTVGFEAVPLTAATIATGVWQDATAGDFTTASSIGKSLYTTGTVPGAAGGLFIAGTNAATTASITGTWTGNIVGTLSTLTTYTGNTPQTGDVFATANAEPTAVPAANASLAAKLAWMATLARNKITQTATTLTVFADDGSTTIAASTVSDNGTTYTRGEYS